MFCNAMQYCCHVHSSSALLKIVQLRLPDIEKTYADLVLQHRARYKQRWVTLSTWVIMIK